ncbi:MAG: HEAT repeat protein [Candidatus Krumholzibacteriia bacterium]|jgi:HEAT repeat protein
MNIRKTFGIGLIIIVLATAGYALAETDIDRQMQEARAALNRAQYELAAEQMRALSVQREQLEVAGNALYWEAFARYRMNKTKELETAIKLLQQQQKEFQNADTAQDGEVLLTRLYAEMAARGEIGAITEIERISSEEQQREETRIQALHALMQMNPDKAMPILEKIVRGETEGSTELRQNALFVLCQDGGKDSEDLLIEMSQTTEDSEMLGQIVMCLSMIGSERSLDAIVALYERSEDLEVEEAAMMAMGQHGGERAFAMLVKTVNDPNRSPDVRAHALMAMAHTGHDDEVVNVINEIIIDGSDPEMLEAALFSLSQISSAAAQQALKDLVTNENLDEDMRAQALYFTFQFEEVTLEYLVDVYNSAEGEDMKMQVCHAIAQNFDNEEGTGALIEISRQESDPELQQNIMFWIGQHNNELAENYLLEIINQE